MKYIIVDRSVSFVDTFSHFVIFVVNNEFIELNKGSSKNPNNLDDVRFLSYSDFFKVWCSRSYIQFKKIAIWRKYDISYLFWVFRGPHK